MTDENYPLTNRAKEIIREYHEEQRKKRLYFIVYELRKRFSVFNDAIIKNVEIGYFISLEKAVNEGDSLTVEFRVRALETLLNMELSKNGNRKHNTA